MQGESRMRDLKSREGEMILAILPVFHPKLEDYKLHLVEPYGIWVENQKHTENMLTSAGVQVAQSTGVVFVPWSGVVVITGTVDSPSLSEKAFGL